MRRGPAGGKIGPGKWALIYRSQRGNRRGPSPKELALGGNESCLDGAAQGSAGRLGPAASLKN